MNRYSFPDNLIPSNDGSRLSKLKQYDVVDTLSEPEFDTISSMAAEIFQAPGAFVNFVDAEKVFFKSNLSTFPTNQVHRNDSLCSLTILEDDITVFYDTHAFNEFSQNPYVHTEGGIRFYAGAPIKTPEGHNIGTVCVIDDQPRNAITEIQASLLKKLASLALEKLESRRMKRQMSQIVDDHLHQVTHDLLNPLTSIMISAQLIQKKAGDNAMLQKVGNSILERADFMQKSISNLLSDASLNEGEEQLAKESVKIKDLTDHLSRDFKMILEHKQQVLHINGVTDTLLHIDRKRIHNVLANLVSNASKYSPLGSVIHLRYSELEKTALFEICDEGAGIAPEEFDKLFRKFSRLSSRPTGNERSHGFGLYTVKVLTEMHGGKVWAESAGVGKGTAFFVELPKY